LTETALIKALQDKDQAAFKELVESYQQMVFNTVLSIVQHEQEAEDISQEVFIQVYISIDGFRQDAKLSTWIYRIATTKALDWERKKRTKKRFGKILNIFGGDNSPVDDLADFNHPGVQMENKEHAAQLFKSLQALPENQKVAFVLIKIEGLNYQQTSEVMNTTVKAVEAYMHRAKINLQKNISKS
jgi:RNA polymerase sigma-70 factor (ECF subfamily)